MSDINLEKDKEELKNLSRWATDIDEWIEYYEGEIKYIENKPISEGKFKLFDTNSKAFDLKKYADKLARAKKAKDEAWHKWYERDQDMKNSVDRQKEFHKWGYTKTNSQSSQNSHNPFKIN